jgi:hypothetical protein
MNIEVRADSLSADPRGYGVTSVAWTARARVVTRERPLTRSITAQPGVARFSYARRVTPYRGPFCFLSFWWSFSPFNGVCFVLFSFVLVIQSI